MLCDGSRSHECYKRAVCHCSVTLNMQPANMLRSSALASRSPQPAAATGRQRRCVARIGPHLQTLQRRMRCSAVHAPVQVLPPQDLPGLDEFLQSLKYNRDELVAVIVQIACWTSLKRPARRLGTFYSRSRKGRWCKGETSGHFLKVQKVFADCDRDSIIYLSDPIGPSCHTGARTCWFSEVEVSNEGAVQTAGRHESCDHQPASTLYALERTIQKRRETMEAGSEEKPSWTSKLLSNPELLCSKVREEAGELCQSLEASEGADRAASEMADLLYHSMVLLNVQGVQMEDVMRVLRKRFGVSGLDEKASRKPKQ